MPRITDIAAGLLAQTTDALLGAVGDIPEDRRLWTQCESARSALDILVECAGVQRAAAMMAKGEPFDYEGTKPTLVDYDSLEKAGALFRETAAEFTAAIQALTEAELERELTMPWGKTVTMAEFTFLPASHNSYHHGQVCYIQLLLGDTEMRMSDD